MATGWYGRSIATTSLTRLPRGICCGVCGLTEPTPEGKSQRSKTYFLDAHRGGRFVLEPLRSVETRPAETTRSRS